MSGSTSCSVTDHSAVHPAERRRKSSSQRVATMVMSLPRGPLPSSTRGRPSGADGRFTLFGRGRSSQPWRRHWHFTRYSAETCPFSSSATMLSTSCWAAGCSPGHTISAPRRNIRLSYFDLKKSLPGNGPALWAGRVSDGPGQLARVPILTRLWANTPCPHPVPGRPARAAGRAHRPAGDGPAPRGCSPSTEPARAPWRCCSSRPGITAGGCAAMRLWRICAASPRSRHRLGKSPGTALTLAVTVRLIMPCGGSYSPAWALPRLPAPMPSAVRPRESPRRRSSAA
jgi:hypothetical protein